MLDSVSGESIKEIWRITPYMFTNSYQHIIIFKDGTHLCTCLLLVSHGIICRHYFKLMVENSNALFHVLLMPTKWFQDDIWIVLMKFLMNHLLDLHPKTQNSFKIMVQFNKLILILCTMIIFKKFNRLEDAFKKKLIMADFWVILRKR